jgi:eukaryotic-like serine/threonine-protein kinase
MPASPFAPWRSVCPPGWSSVNEGVAAEFKGSRNSGVNANQWCQIRVSVRGPRCQCFLDNELLFDLTDRDHLRGAVGFRTWETKVRFRNIRVTAPDGKVLWEGVPELDAIESER